MVGCGASTQVEAVGSQTNQPSLMKQGFSSMVTQVSDGLRMPPSRRKFVTGVFPLALSEPTR